MARNQTPSRATAGFADAGAPRPRTLAFEYEIPNDVDGDNLHAERTASFGSLRSISLSLLTPSQEKSAAHAAKGDTMLLAYELTRRSLVSVTDEAGNEYEIHEHNGTSSELWAQMHPKIRNLAMQAYADNAAPTESSTQSFLKSRKLRA
jgi:hypothetical protein